MLVCLAQVARAARYSARPVRRTKLSCRLTTVTTGRSASAWSVIRHCSKFNNKRKIWKWLPSSTCAASTRRLSKACPRSVRFFFLFVALDYLSTDDERFDARAGWRSVFEKAFFLTKLPNGESRVMELVVSIVLCQSFVLIDRFFLHRSFFIVRLLTDRRIKDLSAARIRRQATGVQDSVDEFAASVSLRS